MKNQCYKDLRLLTKVTCNFLTIVVAVIAVHPGAAQGQPTALSPGLSRLSGTDSSSHIEYVRLFVEGAPVSPQGSSSFAKPRLQSDAEPLGAAAGSLSSHSVEHSDATIGPTLIAQCTRRSSGKLAFELLANFGGVSDVAYYPPWTPANSSDRFPPQLEKATDCNGLSGLHPCETRSSLLSRSTS